MTTALTPPAPALDGLPLTVGLAAREVLLVGAGPVSVRRARTFLEAGALVRVVAPAVDPAMADLAERTGGELVVVVRNFTPADLDTPWMVHVATGDPATDAEVAALCEQRRIWCVTAGDAGLGSVRVPARTAVATPSGPVRIAVDSGDPRRSVHLGRHVARSLATAPAGLRARRRSETGWAALVGGSGDGDLLTVRARRLLHAADVLVVDGPLDAALVAELDDDVDVLRPGTDLPPGAVAQLVAARTAAGQGVVRMVPTTELAATARELRAGGVEFDLVPGVA